MTLVNSLSVLLALTNGHLDIQLGSKPSPDGDIAEQTKVLAAKMGNLVILRKGHVDTISNGNQGQLTNVDVIITVIFYILVSMQSRISLLKSA